jgi:hypothetical protein
MLLFHALFLHVCIITPSKQSIFFKIVLLFDTYTMHACTKIESMTNCLLVFMNYSFYGELCSDLKTNLLSLIKNGGSVI